MTEARRQTEVLQVNTRCPAAADLLPAALALKAGGLVAFPTETVYGLGADATNPAAVAAIFVAKGRPADNPLIVHVASVDAALALTQDVPAAARVLMQRFWPGPLTLVLPRAAGVPDIVTAGLATVAVRMPDHPVALALIQQAGVPLAAPSANRSGRPSPTRAEHVLEDLDGRIDFVLDAGPTGVGLESTVIDLSVDPPVLLRPGGITTEMLCAAIGPILISPGVDDDHAVDRPASPGLKYAHYAPQAELVLVEGPFTRMVDVVRELIHEYRQEGRRVGVLASHESRGQYAATVVLELGSRQQPAQMAAALFACLRAFDHHGVDVIIAEGVPPDGIGQAIMNRLRKAAGGRICRVEDPQTG